MSALSFLVGKSGIDLACFSFPKTLVSYPFFHFLSFLMSVPLGVPSHLNPQNHIYLNKCSTPGIKHWLSGSAFLIGFLCPDPDPDTWWAWSKHLLRNKRWNGCAHLLWLTGPLLGVFINHHAITSWTRALDSPVSPLTAALPKERFLGWRIFLDLSWPIWDPSITCGNQVLEMWLVRLGAELLFIYFLKV